MQVQEETTRQKPGKPASAEEECRKGYRGEVFACTKSTEKECFNRLLFGANRAFAPGVMRVEKGFFLFLFNLDSDVLNGVFRAVSRASLNIEPHAWNGKYPYQVRVAPVHKIISITNARKLLKELGIKRATPIGNRTVTKLLELYRPRNLAMSGWFGLLNNPQATVNLEELEPKEIRTWDLFGEANRIADDAPEEIPQLEATTLWDFPKQSYGRTPKGSNKYPGVTPALIVWNLLWRYTEPGGLIVDPMCGSGTTIDVGKEEGRRVIGYDIAPPPNRSDIKQNDARQIPLLDETVDLVFIDSPYGDNIKYNDDPNCIGKISSETELFYDELEKVIMQCHRILKKGKVLGWLIGDQWVKGKFTPVGFKLYERLCKYFETVDIVCITRRGQSSHTGMWFNRARRLNFYLRGFKYLFIMRKPEENAGRKVKNRKINWAYYERHRNV